jgi:hypothetical protein
MALTTAMSKGRNEGSSCSGSCVLVRDEALDAMVEPQSRQQRPADLYQRAAAAEAVLWRDRLVRELEEAGVVDRGTDGSSRR